MNDIIWGSFFGEMEKFAADIWQLRRMQKVIKPKLFRRFGLEKDWMGMPTGTVSRDAAGAFGVANKTLRKDIPKKVIEAVGEEPKFFKRLQGKIITGKGGLQGAYKEGSQAIYNAPKLPKAPLQREGVGRVGLAHELFETQAKKYRPVAGHLNPNVLIRESNLVRSLPKELAGTKRYYRQLRRASGEEGLMRQMNPNFRYGATKVSPAGRKHFNRKVKTIMDEQLKEM